MNTLKRIAVLLLAASMVYVVAAALRPPETRAGVNAGVVVNNQASQPVPVTGNVGINGTPTVQLAPGSTVGVTGGNFSFSNTSATPLFNRDVDNPARQPFSMNITMHISDSSIGVATTSANLAAGNRYVILSVSVLAQETKGTDANWIASVYTTNGGATHSAHFPVTNVLPGFNGGVEDIFAATQPVYLSADPNTGIGVGVQRVGSTGDGNVIFTVTGYSVAE